MCVILWSYFGLKILILLWVFTLLFSVSKISSKPKQCETCGRDFTKMSQQAFHEHLMKHEDKEHPCTVCPKTFPSARMLRYHKLKVHCKKVVCQCCNQTFSNKYNMQSHLDKSYKVLDLERPMHGDNLLACVIDFNSCNM